ncbi:MAG TPA: RNA polymerase sigma-70 factor [Chitinophagaceae bacterium]
MQQEQERYRHFEAVFHSLYNELANYAFSILKSKEDAEDVVQEVFIRVWQTNPDVLSTPDVKFYLLTSTRNGCISLLRKTAGKTVVGPENIADTAVSDMPPAAPAKDIETLVAEALALLPPQCAAVFKLTRFGGLTYQQTAEALGLSVKTVENQVGKALKIMRDYARRNHISFSVLLALLSLAVAAGWGKS